MVLLLERCAGFGAAVNQVMIGAMHFGMRFWDAFSWAGDFGMHFPGLARYAFFPW